MTALMQDNALTFRDLGRDPGPIHDAADALAIREARCADPAAPPIRVVLVDDDDDFREAVVGELGDLGFVAIGFPDGAALLAGFADGGCADAILLDWHLNGGCGLDLLPELRSQNIEAPVLFLTGNPATAHEQAALSLGALDFVDKARGMAIVAQRVRLIVEERRHRVAPEAQNSGAEADIARGPLLLRPRTSRAFWNGEDVGLTVTEYRIVELMAARPGEYATYRSIYDCVHGADFIAGYGDDGFRTNVRSLIKRIRGKFNALDQEFAEIENFQSFGYRWRTQEERGA